MTMVAVLHHAEHVADVAFNQLDTEDTDTRAVQPFGRIEYQTIALSRLHLIMHTELYDIPRENHIET